MIIQAPPTININLELLKFADRGFICLLKIFDQGVGSKRFEIVSLILSPVKLKKGSVLFARRSESINVSLLRTDKIVERLVLCLVFSNDVTLHPNQFIEPLTFRLVKLGTLHIVFSVEVGPPSRLSIMA